MKNSSQSRKRIDWIDYAKGIGIFLVVLGHVLRGLSDSIGLAYLSELQAADAWIYAFHMPFFFFLSGLFARSSEEKTTRKFLLDKLRNILYPYVIWSGIVGVLRVISGQSEESLFSFIAGFWRIIYQPIDIFWFLYVLFLISTIYFLLRKVNIAPIYILIGAIFLYCFYLFFPQISFWMPLEKTGIYSTYFVLGAVLSDRLINYTRSSIALLLAGTIYGFTVLSIAIHFDFLTSKEPTLVLSLIGIASCLLLAKLLHQLEWLKFFKNWGYLSLQIYVAHTAAAALTRIILQKAFSIDVLMIHIALGTAAGIYVPIALNWIGEKVNFPYLFTIPRQTKAT